MEKHNIEPYSVLCEGISVRLFDFFYYSRVHYFVCASEFNFCVYSCVYLCSIILNRTKNIYLWYLLLHTVVLSKLYSEKGSLNPRNAGVLYGKLK